MKFLLLPLVLMTTGCASMTATVETSSPVQVVGHSKAEVCSAWKSIGWSKKDTDETIREVKDNNSRHQVWCKK